MAAANGSFVKDEEFVYVANYGGEYRIYRSYKQAKRQLDQMREYHKMWSEKYDKEYKLQDENIYKVTLTWEITDA